MTTNKQVLLAAAVAAVLAAPIATADTAAAEDSGFVAKKAGTFMVRGRAIAVLPKAGDQVDLGGVDTGYDADLSNSVVPEVDFSYFLTDNIALELIAATTPHDTRAEGVAPNLNLGSVWLLPPTLSVQYHFMPESRVSPYVGVGVNYTIFYGVDNGDMNSVEYDNAFGASFQFGLDYAISGRLGLNIDVKRLILATDVTVKSGANTFKSEVDIDPWIVGVGLSYKF